MNIRIPYIYRRDYLAKLSPNSTNDNFVTVAYDYSLDWMYLPVPDKSNQAEHVLSFASRDDSGKLLVNKPAYYNNTVSAPRDLKGDYYLVEGVLYQVDYDLLPDVGGAHWKRLPYLSSCPQGTTISQTAYACYIPSHTAMIPVNRLIKIAPSPTPSLTMVKQFQRQQQVQLKDCVIVHAERERATSKIREILEEKAVVINGYLATACPDPKLLLSSNGRVKLSFDDPSDHEEAILLRNNKALSRLGGIAQAILKKCYHPTLTPSLNLDSYNAY